MENESKKPSFLETPAGNWGLAIPVIVLVLGFIFSGPIMAAATVALTAMLTIVGVGVAYGFLGVLALILIHGLFIDGWLMLKYQVFCNNLRKSIIDENPLTILRLWMERAQKRMKEIREGMGLVAGKKKETETVYESFKKDFVDFQNKANHFADNPAKESEFRSACNGLATAAEMIKDTGKDLEIVTNSSDRLAEAYKELEIMMADMKYKESALIRKYQTSGALDAVWGRMRSIFKQDSEEDTMREQAIESINTQYSARMGRVEIAMNDCKGKIDGMKDNREMKEVEGIALFNQLRNVNVEHLATPTPVAIAYTTQNAVFTPANSYANIGKK